MNQIILIVACAIGMLVIFDQTRRYGFAHAWQGPVFILALSIPIAIYIPIRSVFLDNRMIMAMFVGFMFLRQSPERLARLRAVPSDLVLLMLFVSLIASEVSNRTVTPFGLVYVFLQWIPPYALGRVFITESRDLRHVMQPICVAAVAWSFLSVVEGVTRVNMWSKFAGVAMDYEISEVRFGMQRAYGSQAHPISWGLTLAMLLPVMIEAARLAKRGEGRRWWIAAPWLMIPGYVACGSRAVQLTVLLIVIANIYYLFPRMRAGILWLGLAMAVGFFAFRDDVINLMASTVDDVKNPEYIVIRGERHAYTGTKHRDLLFLVYEDAINEAGWLGYGNPLQNVPLDPYVDDRFISVDNHFLHCFLHNGLLGLAFFCLFFLAVLGNLVFVVIRGGPELGLATTSLGCTIGMLITFRTVWMDGNFAWFFMWLCGISATLVNATLNPAPITPYHQPHDER
ncbi:O-antigen ligase family protein [Zavarzinella formosa]|uniref:O-antigen ligase family protein n=1 Tax=Zavarzinella formosa TaxID=360055 RepID=UPI00037E8E86|nr:O-antigen ligase family protein [Zavarzinella formosa]